MLDDKVVRSFNIIFQHKEAQRYLTLQVIMDADNCAFSNIRMFAKGTFNATSRKSVAGNINNIISSRHDINVPILVDEASITGLVVSGELLHIAFNKPIVCFPQSKHTAWRERQFNNNISHLPSRQLMHI